jgi:hypothetical protein
MSCHLKKKKGKIKGGFLEKVDSGQKLFSKRRKTEKSFRTRGRDLRSHR